jgi:hypothetical protein
MLLDRPTPHPRATLIVASCLFLMFCFGQACAARKEVRIEPGVYRKPSTTEKTVDYAFFDGARKRWTVDILEVEPRREELEFRMRATNGTEQHGLVRRYPYGLSKVNRGRLLIEGPSATHYLGINHFHWFWDGKNIVRKEISIGETLIYARDEFAPR